MEDSSSHVGLEAGRLGRLKRDMPEPTLHYIYSTIKFSKLDEHHRNQNRPDTSTAKTRTGDCSNSDSSKSNLRAEWLAALRQATAVAHLDKCELVYVHFISAMDTSRIWGYLSSRLHWLLFNPPPANQRRQLSNPCNPAPLPTPTPSIRNQEPEISAPQLIHITLMPRGTGQGPLCER